MRQVISPPATPATPQGNRSFSGQDLERVIKEAVGGTLATVRNGLQEELDRAISRRDELTGQLASTPAGSGRTRLQSRIDDANTSIEKLQTAIGKLETKIEDVAPVAGSLVPPRLPPLQRNSFNPENMIISVMVILFVAFPLAITFARLLWRRSSNTTPPQLTADSTRRFDRLEQSVDSIAIEIERISENQRYLTKLLGEPRQNASVASGKNQP